jgi:hypothetical protein
MEAKGKQREKRVCTLKCSGPLLPTEGQWDEKREQRHRCFPRLFQRFSSRPRPVQELRLGIPGWEGSAHFARVNSLPGFPQGWRAFPMSAFTRFDSLERTRRDGTGVP